MIFYFSHIILVVATLLAKVGSGNPTTPDNRFVWRCSGEKAQFTNSQCDTNQDKTGCYFLEFYNKFKSCGRLCDGVELHSIPAKTCRAHCKQFQVGHCKLEPVVLITTTPTTTTTTATTAPTIDGTLSSKVATNTENISSTKPRTHATGKPPRAFPALEERAGGMPPWSVFIIVACCTVGVVGVVGVAYRYRKHTNNRNPRLREQNASSIPQGRISREESNTGLAVLEDTDQTDETAEHMGLNAISVPAENLTDVRDEAVTTV